LRQAVALGPGPYCSGCELNVVAAIRELPVVKKTLPEQRLDPRPPPSGQARDAARPRQLSTLSRRLSRTLRRGLHPM